MDVDEWVWLPSNALAKSLLAFLEIEFDCWSPVVKEISLSRGCIVSNLFEKNIRRPSKDSNWAWLLVSEVYKLESPCWDEAGIVSAFFFEVEWNYLQRVVSLWPFIVWTFRSGIPCPWGFLCSDKEVYALKEAYTGHNIQGPSFSMAEMPYGWGFYWWQASVYTSYNELTFALLCLRQWDTLFEGFLRGFPEMDEPLKHVVALTLKKLWWIPYQKVF